MAIINGNNFDNTLTGTNSIDSIYGFGGDDILDGRGSRDSLYGGSGDDTFRYINSSHLDSGEILSGGTGHDRILINNTGDYNFRLATLSSIEEVEFGGGDNTYARFYSSQLGAGLSSTAVIDGWSVGGINDYLRFHVNTASLDLSNLVFLDWVEADDHVNIFGTNSNETVTGSDVDDSIFGYGGNDILLGHTGNDHITAGAGNDTLNGGVGVDRLYGGEGNDTFRYTNAAHLASGELVNGGLGHDRLLLSSTGDYNFHLSSLTAIEEVEFGSADNTYANFYSSQLGTGLSATAVIDGYASAGINDYLQFYMNTTSLNLANLVFQQWDEVDDHVYIYGNGANNSITGSDVDDDIHGNIGDDSLSGHTGNDRIFGGTGNDTLNGGVGEDQLYGGAGNDTFQYTTASHLVSGEVINGGAGHDKLLLTSVGTYNFRVASLSGIEEVEFGGGDNTYARFNSSQLGSGLSTTAVIDGWNAAGINDYLQFYMNTISLHLSNLVFADWVEADDHVYIYGNASNNAITGSDVDDNISGAGGNDDINAHTGNDYINGGIGNDVINGGIGNDTLYGNAGEDSLYGGSGNDAFRYFSNSELVDGEIISGSTGTDKIEIRGSGNFDFRDMVMTSIEEIEYTTSDDNNVYLESSDIGGTGLSSTATIDGNSSAGANNNLRVYMNSGSVDLSGMSFQDWVEVDDHVFIYGRESANDTITGSDQDDYIHARSGNDILRGHEGQDALYGGSGNDIFRYYAVNEVESGEVINGSTGTDKIEIRGSGYFNFSSALLGSIEEIEFTSAHDNYAVIYSSQLGSGISSNARIDGNSGFGAENRLSIDVNTANTDLTGLVFQDWVEADDDVLVIGNSSANTVLGTYVGDTIYGNAGNDVIRGFNGDDYLSGGVGNDQVYGGNGDDSIFGSSGTNTLAGGRGHDLINGGTGVDTIYGNIGLDEIYGNGGSDVIYAGGWSDTAYGGVGNDIVHGNYGHDRLYGESGHDFITGGSGIDRIFGGTGNDSLFGNGYGDILYGGTGSDALNGGAGSDNLWGGDGVVDDSTLDRFVFESTFGHDQIHDFENGIDRIDFSGNATFNSFANVSANAVQSGSDILITQDVGSTLRISDMNLASLDGADFIF